MNQYNDAQRELEAELVIDPENAQAFAYLGDIEMKRGNPEKAIVPLKKAIQLSASLRLAYLDLGEVYERLKQYDDAVAALAHAIDLDPAQPDAHYRLGHVYHSMGKGAESQKEFAKGRELHQKADEDMVRKMASAPPSLGGPSADSPQNQQPN